MAVSPLLPAPSRLKPHASRMLHRITRSARIFILDFRLFGHRITLFARASTFGKIATPSEVGIVVLDKCKTVHYTAMQKETPAWIVN
jgi:hypothetical protein